VRFKRADVEPTVYNAGIAALVLRRRRSKGRVTCIDGWTPGQQGVGECRPTIILQRPQQRIDVDLVAGPVR